MGAGGKTWRAYLSTSAAGGQAAVNARDRIGRGPWQNAKGVVVAQSVDDLHSDNNRLGKENSLTEKGAMVNQGGGENPSSWNSAHASSGCSQANLVSTGGAGLFYCFAQ